MALKAGLFGGDWEDYHDQNVQPLLDQYDQQINDILASGAHGEIARMQAEDDALGTDGGDSASGTAQGLGNAAPTPLSDAGGGQVRQTSFPLGGQDAGALSSFGNDANLRPVHLDLGAPAPGQPPPDSAALLGRAAYPQTVNLQNAMSGARTDSNSNTGNESFLGRARNIYSGIVHAVTSPEFTDTLKRQGEYAKRAGDTVGLGGTGLAVAGTVTAQPELLLPGLAGMGVGDTLTALGSAAVALSDALAQNRNAAIRDSIGGLVGSKLPYTIDPQPAVNGTGKYFGF